MTDPENEILMESGVSHRDGSPFVTLTWGDNQGQLSPDEVRIHALAILETAEAAETDACIYRAFTSMPGNNDPELAFATIRLIRDQRAIGWPKR